MIAFLAKRTGRVSPFPHFGVLFPDIEKVFHNIGPGCKIESLANFSRPGEKVQIIAKVQGVLGDKIYKFATEYVPQCKWTLRHNCQSAARNVFTLKQIKPMDNITTLDELRGRV